jgi:hypothetical protein
MVRERGDRGRGVVRMPHSVYGDSRDQSAIFMAIPPFNIDGVVPPFVGARGPGGSSADMSPYVASALEIVVSFGSSDLRKSILRGWLAHRAAVRAIGFDRGFQWVDGSFVEDKVPGDIDVVSFFFRPLAARNHAQLSALMQANRELFFRSLVKAKYKVDLMLVDLNGSPEILVEATRYYFGLFSHRRGDHVWKGMVRINLGDFADETAALGVLGSTPPVAASGATP